MSFCLSVCKCLNNFLANLQRFFKFCDRSLKFIFYRSAEALKVFVLVLCSLVFDYQWYWSRAWRGGGVWFQAGNNDCGSDWITTRDSLSLGIRVSPMLLLIQLFKSEEFQVLESYLAWVLNMLTPTYLILLDLKHMNRHHRHQSKSSSQSRKCHQCNDHVLCCKFSRQDSHISASWFIDLSKIVDFCWFPAWWQHPTKSHAEDWELSPDMTCYQKYSCFLKYRVDEGRTLDIWIWISASVWEGPVSVEWRYYPLSEQCLNSTNASGI